MVEPKDSENFWEALVEDNTKLGYVQNVVPIEGLSYERAKTVANRTNSKLEVRGRNYIFVQERSR